MVGPLLFLFFLVPIFYPVLTYSAPWLFFLADIGLGSKPLGL